MNVILGWTRSEPRPGLDSHDPGPFWPPGPRSSEIPLILKLFPRKGRGLGGGALGALAP